MKKTFEIDTELVKGIAILLDIAEDEVESDEIESLLLITLEHERNRYQDKAEALQEVISSQYIPYNPEKENKHEA